MTAALEGVSGQQHAPATFYPRERPGTYFAGGWVGPRAGLDGGKISSPPGFFITNILLFRHNAYISAHVTDNVSIVPALRVSIGQGTLLLPHTTVPFDPPISHTLYSYTSHTFPCPITSHCTRVQGWHTLRPMYNTESHPFLHLMVQGTFLLVGLHAPEVHAPHSHRSISVPLLPLPKHCNKSHPDAAAPRCVPLVGS